MHENCRTTDSRRATRQKKKKQKNHFTSCLSCWKFTLNFTDGWHDVKWRDEMTFYWNFIKQKKERIVKTKMLFNIANSSESSHKKSSQCDLLDVKWMEKIFAMLTIHLLHSLDHIFFFFLFLIFFFASSSRQFLAQMTTQYEYTRATTVSETSERKCSN